MAVLHQGIQRLQGLLYRRGRVEAVDLVQIDVVGLQSPQAGLALAHDMAPGGATGVGTFTHRPEHLGGQYDILAADVQILQGLAHDALTGTTTVHVGGIDKVDARLQGRLHQLIGLFLLQLADQPPHVVPAAEGHGAQAQFRYKQPRVAQRPQAQGCVMGGLG